MMTKEVIVKRFEDDVLLALNTKEKCPSKKHRCLLKLEKAKEWILRVSRKNLD